MPSDDYRVIIKADKTPTNEHQRRFNAPTLDEARPIDRMMLYNIRFFSVEVKTDMILPPNELIRLPVKQQTKRYMPSK